MGYDADIARKQQLERFDAQRAQALSGLGAQLGDVSHLGTTIDKLSGVALEGARQRSDLERSMIIDEQERKRRSLLEAIGVGQQQAELERMGYGTGISALAQAVGAREPTAAREFQAEQAGGQMAFAERMADLDRQHDVAMQAGDIAGAKEIEGVRQRFAAEQQASQQAFQERIKGMDIASQENLMKLQNQLDTGMLMHTQDFQAAQADLDRELQGALAAGDTQKAITLLQMQADYDSQSQQAAQDFAAAERIATQSWHTGERLSQQDYEQGIRYFDRETQMMSIREQAAASLEQQLAGFGHDEKMTNLAAQLDEARATNDVGRQQVLMDYQSVITQAATLQEQGFIQSQTEYDALVRQTMQDKEISTQKFLANQQNNLALHMQTQDMAHEEKILYIQDEIQRAAAEGDFARQKELMSFGAEIDFSRMAEEQGFEAAQADLNRKQQIALQQGDFENSQVLQKMNFQFQAYESAKDRALETARLEMAQTGQDMAAMESQFDMIMAGQGEAAAMDYLRGELSKSGITIAEPDPMDAYKALDEQHSLQLYQFAQTNPNYVTGNDADGLPVLGADGQAAFNQFFNTAVFGGASPTGISTKTGRPDVSSLDPGIQSKASTIEQIFETSKADALKKYNDQIASVKNMPQMYNDDMRAQLLEDLQAKYYTTLDEIDQKYRTDYYNIGITI
jgi:hypothetical protein